MMDVFDLDFDDYEELLQSDRKNEFQQDDFMLDQMDRIFEHQKTGWAISAAEDLHEQTVYPDEVSVSLELNLDEAFEDESQEDSWIFDF